MARFALGMIVALSVTCMIGAAALYKAATHDGVITCVAYEDAIDSLKYLRDGDAAMAEWHLIRVVETLEGHHKANGLTDSQIRQRSRAWSMARLDDARRGR